VKFLIDNQLPSALAKWLESHGQEALHVLDVGLAEAKDEAIRSYVQANGLVLITKDEDFSRRATGPGTGVAVVWVRLGNCRKAALLSAFDNLLPQILAALEGGSRLIEIR
jgi:predicted nuclease of predicted toxin-antitoxin system